MSSAGPKPITPLPPDPSFEVSLRPPMFSEFTGQEKV
jgi:Holliday junction resolvasome RuvABC ATP-dependent DNA helicase subunit